MIAADETFDGTWPYEPNFFEGNGFRQHYIDVRASGAETDDVIVCLHGEPTWGYLYRNFIPRLSRLGRVIVPDHMGFGKSETPQDRLTDARAVLGVAVATAYSWDAGIAEDQSMNKLLALDKLDGH